MKQTKIQMLLLFAAITWTGAVLAGGDHHGGHHPAEDDSAIGQPGAPGSIHRTIAVTMSDNMRFTPSNISVQQGETVRFVIKNKGQVTHELSLGTKKELLAHLELMKKFPDMEHDEPNKVTLNPGQQGEIFWQFTKAGVVNFACLMPGHYESGMKGSIKVGKKSIDSK